MSSDAHVQVLHVSPLLEKQDPGGNLQIHQVCPASFTQLIQDMSNSHPTGVDIELLKKIGERLCDLLQLGASQARRSNKNSNNNGNNNNKGETRSLDYGLCLPRVEGLGLMARGPAVKLLMIQFRA